LRLSPINNKLKTMSKQIYPFYTLFEQKDFERFEDEKIRDLVAKEHSIEVRVGKLDTLDVLKIREHGQKDEVYITKYGDGYIISEDTFESDSENIKNFRKKAGEVIKNIWALKRAARRVKEKEEKEEAGEVESDALLGLYFPLFEKNDFEDIIYDIDEDNNKINIKFYGGVGKSSEPGKIETHHLKDDNNNFMTKILNFLKTVKTRKYGDLENKVGIKYKDKKKEYRDTIIKLCIQHNGYLLCKKKLTGLHTGVDRTWTEIKQYTDIRVAEYRRATSYARGIINFVSVTRGAFNEYTTMFGENFLFNKQKRHGELRWSFEMLGETIGEVLAYIEETVTIKLTDDMRATQRALELLDPALLTVGILTFVAILITVFNISSTELIGNINPLKIFIVVISIIMGLFWITHTLTTYIRTFMITTGAYGPLEKMNKDTFMFIFGVLMAAISLIALINKFEMGGNNIYIVLAYALVLLFYILFILTLKRERWGDEMAGWIIILTSMIIGVMVTVFFHDSTKDLELTYQGLLVFVFFMLVYGIFGFANKLGTFIIQSGEVDNWVEFKAKKREEWYRTNPYENDGKGADPYKGLQFGEMFRDFMKYRDSVMHDRRFTYILYTSVLLQALAITFNATYLLEPCPEYASALLLAATASFLTTTTKFSHLFMEKKITVYTKFSVISSIIADLHLLPALLFLCLLNDPHTAQSLALGALIVNLFALIFVLKDLFDFKGKKGEELV